MSTLPPPQRDPRLVTIERKMAEYAHKRAEAMREAESLTKGLKGFLAGWKGERDARVDAALEIAKSCQAELARLYKLRDERIAELDPAKGEELALMEERRLMIERAAAIRKNGGAKAAMLDQLERERRKRVDYIEALEHAVFVGERASDAIEQYAQRLRADQVRLEGSITGQMGRLASVGTVGAEARESLLNFIDRVGVADPSMVRIAQGMQVDREEELQRCARNQTDVLALMTKTRKDLEDARQELRPIESAYRSLLTISARNYMRPS